MNNWFSFSSISSKHLQWRLHSQTVRARKQTFWEKFRLLQPVTCNVSPVMCVVSHLSHVTYSVSQVTCHVSFYFLDKVSKLVNGGCFISRAPPSSFDYQLTDTQHAWVPVNCLWALVSSPASVPTPARAPTPASMLQLLLACFSSC